jgi:hypothetical protein
MLYEGEKTSGWKVNNIFLVFFSNLANKSHSLNQKHTSKSKPSLLLLLASCTETLNKTKSSKLGKTKETNKKKIEFKKKRWRMEQRRRAQLPSKGF